MSRRPYNAELTSWARDLRNNATKQENRLWYEFLREHRPRFTRQRIIGNYILDFYCGKAMLAIEVDGSQHMEPDIIEQDRIRTNYLETLGIEVIRFTNQDINDSFDVVRNVIRIYVETRLSNPRRFAAPPS